MTMTRRFKPSPVEFTDWTPTELRAALQGASLGDCKDTLQRIHSALGRSSAMRDSPGTKSDDAVALTRFANYSAMIPGSEKRAYLEANKSKILRGARLYEAEQKETSK